MGKQELSIPALANKITIEPDAYPVERLRWKVTRVPQCGVIDGHYFLTPKPLIGAPNVAVAPLREQMSAQHLLAHTLAGAWRS